jgi:hypothetical protein
LVKENEAFGVKRVFHNGLFGNKFVGGMSYMLFYPRFKGSTSLTYVIFLAREMDLVNTWAKHKVSFFFCRSKKLFKAFKGFEYGYNIILS